MTVGILNPSLAKRQLSFSEGEWRGVVPLQITCTAGAPDTVVTDLLTYYPIGASWSASLPRLRVKNFEIEWIDETIANVTVHYSELVGDDIVIEWENGASTTRTRLDADANLFANDKTADVFVPSGVLIYERTECDLGYFDRGVLIPWNPVRYSWTENAFGDALATGSQLQRAAYCQCCTNLALFAGAYASKTMLCFPPEPKQLDDRYISGAAEYLKYRVKYRFGYKPFRDDGWGFRHPVTLALHDIYDTASFTVLQLTFPGGNPL